MDGWEWERVVKTERPRKTEGRVYVGFTVYQTGKDNLRHFGKVPLYTVVEARRGVRSCKGILVVVLPPTSDDKAG